MKDSPGRTCVCRITCVVMCCHCLYVVDMICSCGYDKIATCLRTLFLGEKGVHFCCNKRVYVI